MTGQKARPQPVGEIVAANIRKLREGQKMTYVSLSAFLAQFDMPIPVLGLRRIENGQRKITVDELVVFAAIFGVRPEELLRPWTCATCNGNPPIGFTCKTCGAS